MNRRNLVRAVATSPVAVAVSGAAAFAQSENRCVFMEEREGAFVIEGSGSLLTEVFAIDAGRYRIEIEMPSNGGRRSIGIWIDFIDRLTGETVDAFILSDSDGAPEFASGTVEFPEDTEYLAEVSLYSGDWKVVISPL